MTTSFFLDANHAWVAETLLVGPQLTRVITFGTVDGGETWDKGTAISVKPMGPDQELFTRLYFVDPKHGWLLFLEDSGTGPDTLIESDMLYATQDGGLHWRRVAVESNGASGCGWSAASFASVNEGWMTMSCSPGGTGPVLLATHDGGVTWSVQQLPLAAANVSCPCTADAPVFFDGVHGVLLVKGNTLGLFVTSDGGNSWSPRGLPGETQVTVDFIDANHGWTVAGPSALFPTKDASGHFPSTPEGAVLPLYRTDDGGLTWVPVPTSLLLATSEGRVGGLYFVDQKNGFVDRFNVATQQDQLLKTTDGGQTWTVVGPGS